MKTEHLRKKLEEEKAKLEQDMQGVGRKSQTVPDDWERAPAELAVESDPVDQAEVIVSRENDAAVLNALEAHYDNVIAALKRIEHKTYGRCEVCGEPIAEARLEANPSATTCALHMR